MIVTYSASDYEGHHRLGLILDPNSGLARMSLWATLYAGGLVHCADSTDRSGWQDRYQFNIEERPGGQRRYRGSDIGAGKLPRFHW